MTESETLEELHRPLPSATVAVNVLLPAPVPAFTMTLFVQTFSAELSNTIVTDELPPIALASNATPVTEPSPGTIVTLTNTLWPHVNDCGDAVIIEAGGTWELYRNITAFPWETTV
jgi:hypothetical protein